MAQIAVAVVVVAVGIYAATRTVEVPGQKLGNLARQTAKEGEPRLIVWGVVRPIGGNLLAVQEPPRIVKKKQKSGGKGGGGSSTSTEVPFRTYAVGICEGPITGIRRVWRNNKLVYDARPGSEWGAKNNGTFLKKARFFLGGWDQMPSSDLEAVFGVGNVPPMRGTAYMVMADEDLGDMGGAVPQWIFEVVRAEGYAVTSLPYPLQVVESVESQGGSISAIASTTSFDEVTAGVALIQSGALRTGVLEYSLPGNDAAQQLAAEIDAGALRQSVRTIDQLSPDEVAAGAGSLASGALRRSVVNYSDYPPEAVGAVVAIITEGSLT